MTIKSTLAIIATMACIGCSGGSDSGFSGEHPSDAGRGFVFAIAEKYTNKPVSIVDDIMLRPGETELTTLLYSGAATIPFLHRSGTVAVTEPCFYNSGFGDIEYRRISAITATGGTTPLTPCSNDIESPSGFTWIESGHLSPNGRRLAAHLYSPGEAPISIVFEDGSEVARYSGYGLPNWIDDNTLVMVGSTLVTARIGQEPVVINDDVAGASLRNVAVSPNGSQLAFEWQSGVWFINVDGTGLRELLPAAAYMFPTWSPDGRWVAALQREAPSALDGIIIGIGVPYEYTNLQEIFMVHVESGELWTAGLTSVMNDSQMPQGGLSWY